MKHILIYIFIFHYPSQAGVLMLIIHSLSFKMHNSFTGMATLNPGTIPVFTLSSGRNGLFLTPLEHLYWYGLNHKKSGHFYLNL